MDQTCLYLIMLFSTYTVSMLVANSKRKIVFYFSKYSLDNIVKKRKGERKNEKEKCIIMKRCFRNGSFFVSGRIAAHFHSLLPLSIEEATRYERKWQNDIISV